MFEVLNAGNKPPLRCLPNIHDLIARQVVAKCLSFGGVQMQGLDLPDKVDICAAFAGKFDISDIFEIHDDVWLKSEQFEVVRHCMASQNEACMKSSAGSRDGWPPNSNLAVTMPIYWGTSVPRDNTGESWPPFSQSSAAS